MTPTLIIIYILSTYFMYKHTKTAHSKYGRWWNLRIKTIDLIFCFIPFINTIAVLLAYIFYPPIRKNKQNTRRKLSIDSN